MLNNWVEPPSAGETQKGRTGYACSSFLVGVAGLEPAVSAGFAAAPF
jgi:hypothetical protein